MKQLLIILVTLLVVVDCDYNCRDDRKEALKDKKDSKAKGWVYVPHCEKKKGKDYAKTQCKVKDGQKKCKCVLSDGTDETFYSRSLTSWKACEPKRCDEARVISNLVFQYLLSHDVVVDARVNLKCMGNGRLYQEVQCISGFVYQCWKVDTRTGELVEEIDMMNYGAEPSTIY